MVLQIFGATLFEHRIGLCHDSRSVRHSVPWTCFSGVMPSSMHRGKCRCLLTYVLLKQLSIGRSNSLPCHIGHVSMDVSCNENWVNTNSRLRITKSLHIRRTAHLTSTAIDFVFYRSYWDAVQQLMPTLLLLSPSARQHATHSGRPTFGFSREMSMSVKPI